MKKILVLTLALILFFSFTACTIQLGRQENNPTENTLLPSENPSEVPSNGQDTTAQQNPSISRKQAIDIALQAAALESDAVYDLSAELDVEPYGTTWEVDFETMQTEYSYEIDATTGKIIHQETERND